MASSSKASKRNERKRKVAQALASGELTFGESHDPAKERATRIRLSVVKMEAFLPSSVGLLLDMVHICLSNDAEFHKKSCRNRVH